MTTFLRIFKIFGGSLDFMNWASLICTLHSGANTSSQWQRSDLWPVGQIMNEKWWIKSDVTLQPIHQF